MKSMRLFCLIVVLASGRFGAQSLDRKVNVSYDKFDHVTEVSSGASGVSNAIGRKQDKQDLRLQVVYECAGETSHCRPDNVELSFISYSVGEYTGADQLILIANGQRIRLSVKWTGAYERKPLVEHVTAAITLEEFLNVANAEEVEGRLGGTTFALSPENFVAIRALASEIDTTVTK